MKCGLQVALLVAVACGGVISRAGTVALYHLDELGGITAADSVGGHTLTQPVNQPTEGQPAQPGFGTCFGGWTYWDGAYRTTTFPNLTGDWTIEFFFNTLGDTNGDSNPVEFGSGPEDRFRFAPNQGHAFEYRTSSVLLTTGYVDYDANWHHVALTYNATTGTLTLYYDGHARDSAPGTIAATTFLSVGCANYGQEIYFGRVDEVRVSDTVAYVADFTPPSVPFGSQSGACCLASGACVETSEAGCAGVWHGAGSVCDPSPCTSPMGACCHADGLCTQTPEWNCAGTWMGVGVPCEVATCLGACCAGDYSCTLTSVLDCAGQWSGPGTRCVPSPCTGTLTVALYHLDEPYGSAAVEDVRGAFPLTALVNGATEAKPAHAGFGTAVGVWSAYDEAYRTGEFAALAGDWTIEFLVNALDYAETPFGDPCPVQFGADASYRFRFEPADHTFEYRIGESTFVLSTGPITYDALWHHVALTYRAATGECSLFWDGQLRARDNAVIPGTQHLAVGSTYAPNDRFTGLVDELRVSNLVLYDTDFAPPMAPFTVPGGGACCLGDGWCLETTETACHGTWLGAGTRCADLPCPAVTGACCRGDGTCVVTTAWECDGTWHGPGSTCEPNLCRFRPFIGWLGDLPGGDYSSEAWGVSDDGQVVVGRSSHAPDGYEAFRWSAATGLAGLGFLQGGNGRSLAKAASADGTVIVGYSASSQTIPGTTEAFRWTAATGLVGLGDLPGGEFDSDAWGVSADGQIIVGSAAGEYVGWPGFYGPQAFRWTEASGFVSLGNLSGDPYFSVARAISADGSTIVGQSDFSESCVGIGFRWTAAAGMVSLGDLPGGPCLSIARGVSTDGGMIVGTAYSAAGGDAFIWTPDGGMVVLGDLPGGYHYAEAWDVSGDGTLVVGLGSALSGERAFVWDATHGMRELSAALASEHGVDPHNLQDRTFSEARGISPDGRTIVGIGRNALGKTEAWIVRLPAARGDLNGDGQVNVADFGLFSACLAGPGVTEPPPQCDPAVFARADLDGDGDVDVADLGAFQRVFGGL